MILRFSSEIPFEIKLQYPTGCALALLDKSKEIQKVEPQKPKKVETPWSKGGGVVLGEGKGG